MAHSRLIQKSLTYLTLGIILCCWFIASGTDAKQTIDKNQVGLLPKHRLQKRAIDPNHMATGFSWTFDSMGPNSIQIYETKNTTDDGGRVLFALYDVFGFHDNTKQVVDKLADAGKFKIVMPDFFGFGGGWPFTEWPTSTFTPERLKEFQAFLQNNGSFDNVQKKLQALIPYYKEQRNAKQFGIFGFCWGGKMTILASAKNVPVTAAAIIHPAGVNVDVDEPNVQIPMYLIPSMNENKTEFERFRDKLIARLGADNVGYTRFENMNHGFSGARGDFSNPENKKAVEEVIEILNKFFNQHLKSDGGPTSQNKTKPEGGGSSHNTISLMCLLPLIYYTLGFLLDSTTY